MTDALAVVAEQRVLPVVTVESREIAGELGRALAGAGARGVEITFRSEAAGDAIEALAGEGFVVGAGTVRSVAQVDVAIAAGASFVVSPGLDPAVVERCGGGRSAGPAGCRDRVGADRGAVARGVDSEALPGGGARRRRPDPRPRRAVSRGAVRTHRRPQRRQRGRLSRVAAGRRDRRQLDGRAVAAEAGNWSEVERLTAETLALGQAS